ncbi:MAG TPA: ABC transporter ATP-binding protein [Vicinamibacteria bacterium]|nr:ABC transporter ATP-binding protein [Vicinamibacteria bacterium]
METHLAIETRELVKRFGRVEAVRGLTLEVPRGSLCGLLGRNGAGKTTTLKMLMGMTRPSAGEARVLGLRVADPVEAVAIRQRAGFVGEDKLFPRSSTVDELLRFTRALYPRWRSDLEQRYLRAFGLAPAASAGGLSKGARARLALLLAIARGAEILLLDEPTDGLDPAMTEETLQALVSLAAEGDTTILFSSHQLAQVEQIADRVCLIDEGRVVVNDSLDDLKSAYRRVFLVFEGEAPREDFPGARGDGRTLSLLVRGGTDAVVARARALEVRSVDIRPVTLKEIFLETSKGALS